MKTTEQKVNSRLLEIWIADNGDTKARARLCLEANLSLSTLNKILNQGHIPKFGTRYRICKMMGVTEYDLFPGLQHEHAG